jgi:protein involved in polysaccharide export with SLBB domain
MRTVIRRFLAAAVSLTILALTAPSGVAAQAISARDLEMLRQNPDLVRQRIQASGMSEDQIRTRLAAAGFGPNVLDQYLQSSAGDADTLGDPLTVEVLSALGTLGFDDFETILVPESIGMQFPDTTVVDSMEVEVEEIPLFGLGIFERGALFQPTLNGPVPASYRLGPGDELVLIITGDVELIRQLTVTRGGFVVIPQVGQLSVTNLTMDQFRTVLMDRLSRSYSGLRDGTTAFDVTLSRVRMIQVFVTGEVQQPSAYQMASVATVLNALYAAGGPTENGNFRSIQIRRSGAELPAFDLYDYLLEGRSGGDVTLEDGDVVFVPVHGTRASITGAVVRPGEYELAPDETLQDFAWRSHALSPRASEARPALTASVSMSCSTAPRSRACPSSRATKSRFLPSRKPPGDSWTSTARCTNRGDLAGVPGCDFATSLN